MTRTAPAISSTCSLFIVPLLSLNPRCCTNLQITTILRTVAGELHTRSHEVQTNNHLRYRDLLRSFRHRDHADRAPAREAPFSKGHRKPTLASQSPSPRRPVTAELVLMSMCFLVCSKLEHDLAHLPIQFLAKCANPERRFLFQRWLIENRHG